MYLPKRINRSTWAMAMAVAPLLLILGAACAPRPPVLAESLSVRPPTDGLTKQFSGEITQVQSEALKIVDAMGDDQSFAVADDAMVMLNDTEASLDMLHPGLRATVQAESRGGDWVAMSIRAEQEY